MDWRLAEPAPPPGGAALIGKALRLLDLIGGESRPVPASRLLAVTGWPRPTLHRILAALAEEGYIRREAGRSGYVLGYRILELAQTVWAGSDLAAVASLELQRLRNLAGETAYLAIPHRDGVLSIGKFESPHAQRSAARLGVLKPWHCTSQGKAMLAFSDAGEVRRRLGDGPLPRFTAATIVDRAALEADLARVRASGFAIESEEIVEGSRCVGAPILDRLGRPVGAISVAGPTWRLTAERAQQLGPEVAEIARHIGAHWSAVQKATAVAAGRIAVLEGAPEPALYGSDPAWDAAAGSLVWTDLMADCVYRGDGRSTTTRPLPRSGGVACSLNAGGASLAAMQGRLWRLGQGEPLQSLPEGHDATALCRSPDGEVWAAVSDGAQTTVGPLRPSGVEPRWRVSGVLRALCWAPDGAALMASDPERGVIHAGEPGASRMRVFSRIPPASGRPEALAVDEAGRLWVALFDGWSVARLDASGEFADVVALPAPRPTGLAFGGAAGRTLFVTSARYGLSRDVLERAPLSGHVFVVPVDAG